MNTLAKEWEDRYQQGKTGWDRGEASPNLLYWIDKNHLSPCRILVPGCGNGYEVVTLAERGFDVVAIDIASTPIKNIKEVLEARRLKAELIQTDFLSWQPDILFDAIYEQTSLCALSPDDWTRYETCLYDWLKPTGKIFAQFIQTNKEGGPPFNCNISAMMDLFSAKKWHWGEEHKTGVIHSEGVYEKTYLLERCSCKDC